MKIRPRPVDPKRAQRLIYACVVVAGFQLFGRASMAEDRADLSDRRDREPRRFHSIEQGVFGRIDSIILSRFSSAKGAGFACEWPRDDAAYFVRADELPSCDLAPAIEFFKRHNLFVRGDLKHTVG